MKTKKIPPYVWLILIIALGFFLRVYNINNTPPGVYPDEAVNGMDAITANQTGNYQWFYTANQGREGLFMNMIALCFKLFGISVFTLKLPAILAGTLTILGTYLLTKELFHKERPALIAGFLVAVGYWAINFSRISFRANLLPLILSFAFYFLLRGINTKKFYNFAVGGFIFGLGLHTYIAFRIAPAILVIMLASFILSRKNFIKEYWRHILMFILFTLISAAPLLYTFFYSHPEYFASRSASISVLSPDINHGHLVRSVLRTFGMSLAKYNFWGDQNWRHNYPPYPILDTLTGIAFLFGLIYSLSKLFRLIYLRFAKKIRNLEMDNLVLLIVWFFIMLVPEFLAAEGNPHALRSIGTLPVVFIFAAMAFEYFFNQAEKQPLLTRKVYKIVLVVLLISIGTFNSIKYLYFWANKPVVASSFNKNLTDISRYMQTLPKDEYTYVITSYNTLEKDPIQVFNYDRTHTWYLFTNQTDQIQPGDNPFVIIMTGRHEDAIAAIEARYPNLYPQEIDKSLGSSYFIFKNK